jgi:deoxyribodipyrimidine photo-lyase
VTAVLVWFRQDLRLGDHPALAAALATGAAVVPVYVLDDTGEGDWPAGGASRWWLHHSLASLDAQLRERGSRLCVGRGASEPELVRMAAACGARRIFASRRYEPAARAGDERIQAALGRVGIELSLHDGTLLFDPAVVRNKQGGPFQVFTPFWKHCLELEVPEALPAPKGSLPAPKTWPAGPEVGELGLLPRIPWDKGLAETWRPGEATALMQLRAFVREGAPSYDSQRDRPDLKGTSRLSPHLHFGEVTPRQIWAAVRRQSAASGVFPPDNGTRVFLSEVGWREFGYHLLYHFPRTPLVPLRPEFERFPWAGDPGGHLLAAWKKGRTGYPIVDAGMRELWATGWMHNRVRMVVASFLVKHLRLPWTLGARWFWDTLVDADLASNTLGWQWSAGCGADAAPYFRVFAPVKQGLKFDPDGAYVRRWVPELAGLPNEFIHAPWEAPELFLQGAGVRLGETYPSPLVDHATARNAALAAFEKLRQARSS